MLGRISLSAEVCNLRKSITRQRPIHTKRARISAFLLDSVFFADTCCEFLVREWRRRRLPRSSITPLPPAPLTLSTTGCFFRTVLCFASTHVGSKLKALSLRGNRMDDIEAVALAEALEDNTILGSLNLFDNKITDVG